MCRKNYTRARLTERWVIKPGTMTTHSERNTAERRAQLRVCRRMLQRSIACHARYRMSECHIIRIADTMV